MIEMGVIIGLGLVAIRYLILIKKMRVAYKDLMAIVRSVELSMKDGTISEAEAKKIIERVYKFGNDVREMKKVMRKR